MCKLLIISLKFSRCETWTWWKSSKKSSLPENLAKNLHYGRQAPRQTPAMVLYYEQHSLGRLLRRLRIALRSDFLNADFQKGNKEDQLIPNNCCRIDCLWRSPAKTSAKNAIETNCIFRKTDLELWINQNNFNLSIPTDTFAAHLFGL